jgi:hypothetical protein
MASRSPNRASDKAGQTLSSGASGVLSSVSFWIGGGASLASCATEVILTVKDKQQRKTSTSFIILIHLDEADSA